ncbi:hypothetical protein BGZ91_009619, partial [Linnemannia elongata]
MAADAFRHSWKRLGNLYLYPPWNLIHQVHTVTQTGEVGCNSDRPPPPSPLAVSGMVSVGTRDIHLSTGLDPKAPAVA